MIRDILLLQKRELKKRLKERYVSRAIPLHKFKNDLIKVIVGPRRAGKSFFAIHILHKLGNFGYANFDDERLVEVENYNEIIDNINSIYNNPKFLLLDEIQNLPKWELFVNRLKRQGYNLVITGSNSKLLSRELASHLTGRHLPITLFPFSFKEILNECGKGLTESEIKIKLHEYILNGGYPEPLIKKIDYKDYLSTLFDSVIYKDIVKRFNIRMPSAIEDLATYLISNIAEEFSFNTLTKVTRSRSVHTVENYLKYLEEAFIFFRITRFSFKLKRQLTTNKKIYCIDNGLIRAKAFRFSPDFGKLYENIVAIELKRRGLDVFYWKGSQQEEVDFVVKSGLKIRQLIQVCYNIESPRTKQREIRALLKASKDLRCKNLIVITKDYDGEEQAEWFGIKRNIRFVPLWKWLI